MAMLAWHACRGRCVWQQRSAACVCMLCAGLVLLLRCCTSTLCVLAVPAMPGLPASVSAVAHWHDGPTSSWHGRRAALLLACCCVTHAQMRAACCTMRRSIWRRALQHATRLSTGCWRWRGVCTCLVVTLLLTLPVP